MQSTFGVLGALLVATAVVTVDESESSARTTASQPTAHGPARATRVTAELSSDPANNVTEIARVQAHLAQVERELLAADVSHLTDRRRANRMQHIAVLRQYRERGLFPHNHVAAEQTPVFIDEHDTHCAVGYLLAQSGHDALARKIARERNLARVPELVDEPELVAWLNEAGLTMEEAARIQPWYGPGPVPQPSNTTDNDYAVATAVAAGLSGGVIAWNLLADREGSSWWLPGALGVGVGLADGALALGGISKNSVRALDGHGKNVSETLIGVNAAMGLLSTIVGVRTFVLGRTSTSTDPVGNGHAAALLELAPWTAPAGGNGLRVAIRF